MDPTDPPTSSPPRSHNLSLQPIQTPHHHTSSKMCICNQTHTNSPVVRCSTCLVLYHDDCVGLQSLRNVLQPNDAGILPMDGWACPECIVTARLLQPGSPIFDAIASKAAELFMRYDRGGLGPQSARGSSNSRTLSFLDDTSHSHQQLETSLTATEIHPATSSVPTTSTSSATSQSIMHPATPSSDSANNPNTSNKASPRNESPPRSFAEAARKTVPPQPRLTIQCTDVNTTRSSLDKLLEEVPISNVKNFASSICIRFPNEKSRQLAETKLKSSDILSDPTKVTTDVMSKVTLRFVPVDLLPEDSSRDDSHKFCLDKLRAKNDLLRDCPNLSIVYFKRTLKDPNFATVALKLPVEVKAQLLAEGRVFFHMSSVRVYHRVHVKRCPHCQGLGHYPDNCPSRGKPATCMFCMEHHNTDDCPVKNDPSKHICSNCVKTNKSETSHHAGSVKCSAYKEHYDRLSKNSFQPSTLQ